MPLVFSHRARTANLSTGAALAMRKESSPAMICAAEAAAVRWKCAMLALLFVVGEEKDSLGALKLRGKKSSRFEIRH